MVFTLIGGRHGDGRTAVDTDGLALRARIADFSGPCGGIVFPNAPLPVPCRTHGIVACSKCWLRMPEFQTPRDGGWAPPSPPSSRTTHASGGRADVGGVRKTPYNGRRFQTIDLKDGRGPHGDAVLTTNVNSKIAASKSISILRKLEDIGYCGVETGSVYGAAVALPQIARSACWSSTLTALAVRAYIFLVINMMSQVLLLSMIGKEQNISYHFAGQMHLCDYGKTVFQNDCPNGPNCIGPGGTPIESTLKYDFNTWATRTFVRDTMKVLFPERSDVIQDQVTPGEYGLESWLCRNACIFIFMMAVVEDLHQTLLLIKTLFRIPTMAQSWIMYNEPEWEEKSTVKKLQGLTELDLVKFRVAGMPCGWKVFNFMFIVVPKAMLWVSMSIVGVHYLMETSGIVDLIVNAMALTFVLNIDETAFMRFSTIITKHIMSKLEDMPLFSTDREESEADDDALDRFEEEEMGSGRWRRLLVPLIPMRLLAIIFWQIVFMSLYYYRNCDARSDGSYVSKDLHLPSDLTFNPLSLMFGFENTQHRQASWTMPHRDGR